MHIEDQLPVLRFHFQKGLVPENPGIVDQDVNRVEGLQRRLDYIFAAFNGGDTVIVCNGFTSQRLDRCNHLIGRFFGPLPRSVRRAPQVVNHHPGAPFGQLQRIHSAEPGAGTGDNRHAAIKSNLVFNHVAVFENAVIHHHLTGLSVDNAPDGLTVVDFPDQRFNRHTGIQGALKPAVETPDLLWVSGAKTFDQRTTGISMGAKTMHDRPFKAGHFGKFAIHMQLEGVTGKPKNQRLINSRRGCHHHIRFAIRNENLLLGCIFSAESTVQTRKNRGGAGKQFGAVGMMGFEFGNDQGTSIFALVIVTGNGTFGGKSAFRRDGVVEDDFMLAM